ncbi:aldose 1-epimerase family protein [Bifidobacterium choerinum]|uniref:Aldose epimerase n=1 Tax=Bifidobacterium choerinum TaxID=35760 RepID=A0A2D3D7H6_9BIFI|nr:aldose 1-epimerase family protein [Bifidobacterium choerinum]ATU21014.1 aldose epimerase [Bifidobacterium choerinum]
MSLTTNLPPRTGDQYTIEHGRYRAVITELGATLRVLTCDSVDVTVPLGANDIVGCCEGQLLIPFPNRVAGGRYGFDGVDYQLPINEPDRDNAIHGFAKDQYWRLERLDECEATLSWRMPPAPYYPFDLLVTVTYTLDDDGLHILVRAHNHSDHAAPWALAMHPWIANGLDGYGDEIDAQNAQCTLEIGAATHVQVDDDLIPVGTEPVDGTKFDFRTPRALDEQPYDDALTDVRHDMSGNATATLTRPDGRRVAVGGDATITSFQICTGTGFPAAIRPAGVAVEPQTAYANAFNTGIDLIRIEPAQTSETRMFIGMLD